MMSGGVPACTMAVSFWLRSEPPWKPAMYEMSIAQPWALPHSSSSSRTKALWSGWKSWFCRICSLPLTLAPDFGFWIAATAWTTDCDGAGVAVAAPAAAGVAPAAAGAVVAAAAGLAAPAAGLVAAAAGAAGAAAGGPAAGGFGGSAAAGFAAAVGVAGAVVGVAPEPQACRIGATAARPSVRDDHLSMRRRPRGEVGGTNDMKLHSPPRVSGLCADGTSLRLAPARNADSSGDELCGNIYMGYITVNRALRRRPLSLTGYSSLL